MSKDQNKNLAEKAFWNIWGNLESNAINNPSQNEGRLKIVDPIRQDDKEYAARIAQQQADESRKEKLNLMAMVVVGFLAICLIVYLLGLIDMKPETSSAVSGGNNLQSAGQSKEDASEIIEASIEEEVIKGGFSNKEAYFSSELTKQSNDVGNDLIEFSKKIKSVNPKMNITSLVIAGKMDQLTKDKIINGFGIEMVGPRDDESDNVSLISH